MIIKKMKRVLQITINTIFPYKSKKIKYYNQYSLKFFFRRYGKERLGATGCGPFACAIVAASLLNKEIYPDEVATWAFERGFYEYQHGSLHSLIPEYFRFVGLQCEDLGWQTDKLKKRLKEKEGLGILLCKEGKFSRGRHFVVVGMEESWFKIYNSCNVFDCYRKFDENALKSALAIERVYIGPIWLISREVLIEG